MHTRSTDYTVHNVDKALDILEILADSSENLPLHSIADRIDYSRNKTFRLMATLFERGLVDRDTTTGAYYLGSRSVVFGQKLFQSSNLVSYAHPIMEHLARKHHEAVYMTIIKDDDVLFLDMVDCEQQIKAAPLVGKSFPFFTNAAGKVMRALDSFDLLEKLRLKKISREGRPDVDELVSELQEIRAKGVAVDNGGLGDGIISVAVAVRDYAGQVVCALTMLGPSFRMLTDRIECEIIPSMLQGAAVLSGKFGYEPA